MDTKSILKEYVEQSIRNSLSESQEADAAKKRLAKMKGKQVSFTHQPSGEKMTGTYKGMKRMGGRSYAHVETSKGAHRIPPHHIHEATEQLDEVKYDHADVVSWVGDKMNNTQMDIDQMRAAFVKKFGKNMLRYFEAAVDELND